MGPCVRLLPDAETKTDIAYRACYRACLAGPFVADWAARARTSTGELSPPIQSFENDGIVNTASMLWPNGEDTRLVDADHGDIIGHFGGKRPYDLLKSGSGFGETEFKNVWNEVFGFAVGPKEN